jgi:hypothetical protein
MNRRYPPYYARSLPLRPKPARRLESSLTHLSQARMGLAAVAVSGRIYAIGGSCPPCVYVCMWGRAQ